MTGVQPGGWISVHTSVPEHLYVDKWKRNMVKASMASSPASGHPRRAVAEISLALRNGRVTTDQAPARHTKELEGSTR
jgi:hypothetical protein